jgi:DNA-binding transcriptional LysR family regulator
VVAKLARRFTSDTGLRSAFLAPVVRTALGLASARPRTDLIRLLPPEQVLVAALYILVHRDLVGTARVRAVIDFLCERISKYTR